MKKAMKKVLALVLVLTMAFSTAVVAGAKSKKKATKLTYKNVTVKKNTKVVLKKKKKVTLNLAKKGYKATSSKKKVATAKVKGKKVTIKAKKNGTAKITLKKKGYKTVKVTVKVQKKNVKNPAANSTVVAYVSSDATVVNLNTTAKVAKKAQAKIANVKVSGKTLVVSGNAVGNTTVVLQNKSYINKQAKITINVKNPEDAAKATVSADASGKYALPAGKTLDDVIEVKATYKVGGKDVTATLVGADLKAAKEAVASPAALKKFVDDKLAKDAKATFAGVQYEVKGDDVTVSGKTVKKSDIKVDSAKTAVTVKGATAEYKDNAVTVTGTKRTLSAVTVYTK